MSLAFKPLKLTAVAPAIDAQAAGTVTVQIWKHSANLVKQPACAQWPEHNTLQPHTSANVHQEYVICSPHVSHFVSHSGSVTAHQDAQLLGQKCWWEVGSSSAVQLCKGWSTDAHVVQAACTAVLIVWEGTAQGQHGVRWMVVG